jgi:predicted RecB family nuclease
MGASAADLVAEVEAVDEGGQAALNGVLQRVLVYDGDEEAVQRAVGVERALGRSHALIRQQHTHRLLDGRQRRQPLLRAIAQAASAAWPVRQQPACTATLISC